jgi:hypothetical protein
VVLDHNSIIFQKEKKGGRGTYKNHWYARLQSSQGEVGDKREKWGDFWEKSIAINQNIVSRSL